MIFYSVYILYGAAVQRELYLRHKAVQCAFLWSSVKKFLCNLESYWVKRPVPLLMWKTFFASQHYARFIVNHTIDPFRELVCHLGDFSRHLLRQPKLGQCCKKNETCLCRKCRRFQSLLHFYLRFYYKTIKLNYRCEI